MGVFLGMILGVVVALVHNRFIDTEFEGAMAMYGNSKFVFVVLLPIVLVMAVVASYVGLWLRRVSTPRPVSWQVQARSACSCTVS